MDRFLIVLAIAFLVGGGYSFLFGKFFKNKIILFLPTILSFVWIIYVVLTYDENNMGGFYDLAIFLSGLIIFILVIGNIVFNLIFNRKNKKNPK